MKPHVIFKINFKKDLNNWWNTKDYSNFWGKNTKECFIAPIKIESYIKSQKKSKNKLFKQLNCFYKQNNKQLRLSLQNFSKSWKLIEKKYFERLKKIMGKPINTTKFTAYLTTCLRCPYNIKENSFMISFFSSTPQVILTCAHELMHIQFHEYYWKKCKLKLKEERIQDIKEASTIILNEEFSDLLTIRDKGYPQHKELRIKLSEIWKKTKNFDRFIDQSIKYLNTSSSKDVP